MKNMLLKNELKYPFAHENNPNGFEMDKIVAGWINDEYSFLPEKFRKKYLGTGMGYCAGCAYPSASLEQLKAICQFFIWAFSIDDLYEKSSVEKLQETENIAMDGLIFNRFASIDPLFAQLPLMRQQLIAVGSEEWLIHRFCVSLKKYFTGLREALVYRLSSVFPSQEEYIRIRINDVNVFPMVNLAEAITGSILPIQVIDHPSLERLAILTSRILSFANDYFSARQEKGNNVMNLVLLLMNQWRWTEERANEELIKIHDLDVAEFENIANNLPNFGAHQSAVMQYVANLRYMIAGYLNWTLTLTKRYTLGGHPIDLGEKANHQ